MSEFPGELRLLKRVCGFFSRRVWVSLFVLFLVLCFIGLLYSRVASAQSIAHPAVPFSPVGPVTRFSIADFDGDGRPDFATIETGISNNAGTHYWVSLQISSIGRQSIQIVGPSGGLRIEAVDVNNGNHFVDLVLSTILSRQPVAILINDGSGGFSKVPPSAFPDAFTEPAAEFDATCDFRQQDIGILLQQRPATDSQTVRVLAAPLENDLVPIRDSRLGLVAFLNARATRAPPADVH